MTARMPPIARQVGLDSGRSGGQNPRQEWADPARRRPEPLHLPARRHRRWAALRRKGSLTAVA